MEPTAPARAPYLPPLLHHAAFQPDQRGREDALREPEPQAPPGWELSLRGAQLGAPNATGCPAGRAPCPPRTPPSLQGQGKPLPMPPLLPPRHPAETRESHQQCPSCPQNPSCPKKTAPPDLPEQPCSGVSTHSTSLQGEGTSSARLGVLAPAAGTKEGAGTHVGPLTLGGLQDVHHLPDLQREVMLLGAREVPHGCGKRGWKLGSLPGVTHQPPSSVHLHPTASPPQHPRQSPSPTNSVRPPTIPTPRHSLHRTGQSRIPQDCPFWNSGVPYGTPLPDTHTLGAGGPTPGTGSVGRQVPAEPLPRAGGPGTALSGDSGAGGRGGVWQGQELSGGQPLPAQLCCCCPCCYFWPQGELWGRQPWFGPQSEGQSLHSGVPARTMPVPTLRLS